MTNKVIKFVDLLQLNVHTVTKNLVMEPVQELNKTLTIRVHRVIKDLVVETVLEMEVKTVLETEVAGILVPKLIQFHNVQFKESKDRFKPQILKELPEKFLILLLNK